MSNDVSYVDKPEVHRYMAANKALVDSFLASDDASLALQLSQHTNTLDHWAQNNIEVTPEEFFRSLIPKFLIEVVRNSRDGVKKGEADYVSKMMEPRRWPTGAPTPEQVVGIRVQFFLDELRRYNLRRQDNPVRKLAIDAALKFINEKLAQLQTFKDMMTNAGFGAAGALPALLPQGQAPPPSNQGGPSGYSMAPPRFPRSLMPSSSGAYGRPRPPTSSPVGLSQPQYNPAASMATPPPPGGYNMPPSQQLQYNPAASMAPPPPPGGYNMPPSQQPQQFQWPQAQMQGAPAPQLQYNTYTGAPVNTASMPPPSAFGPAPTQQGQQSYGAPGFYSPAPSNPPPGSNNRRFM